MPSRFKFNLASLEAAAQEKPMVALNYISFMELDLVQLVVPLYHTI